ncbi:MAG: hypothetical protein Q7U51_02715 [Methanoregula sp.]|nr:hypothetical protein [Methanoregula sp.]
MPFYNCPEYERAPVCALAGFWESERYRKGLSFTGTGRMDGMGRKPGATTIKPYQE